MGVDEAGYGPNLGPLVIAASLWSAPANFTETQFADALATTFMPRPHTAGCEHVPLGDSKQLYAPHKGLATLEAGLLALFHTLNVTCDNLGDFIQRLTTTELIDDLQALEWYTGYARGALPLVAGNQSEGERLARIAAQQLSSREIQLVDLRAAIICEPRFNQAVTASGSKGELLSRVTLELVVSLLEQCVAETEIFCDRQGGRKNYLPNLLAAMPDEWFFETRITAARSSYRSQGARPMSIHFSVGGDSFPPTALASMLAKYLRERLMEVLNAYWQQHVADLRPTAGYPVDAQRFRLSIEPIAQRLNWNVNRWWRCK